MTNSQFKNTSVWNDTYVKAYKVINLRWQNSWFLSIMERWNEWKAFDSLSFGSESKLKNKAGHIWSNTAVTFYFGMYENL